MKIKWGLLGMLLSAAAVVCEFLGNGQQEAEKDARIDELEAKVAQLEQKED